MSRQRSSELFKQAQNVMPGGVSSPVRAFKSVGGDPIFFERGEGPYMIDVDGNRYIDYVLSWGPLVLGHAHADVTAAIHETALRGTSFGAPSPLEIELAELTMQLMPNIEMLRFVNSGTEACMSVLRLARAFTGRNKIVKFQGNYHGHADMLLVQAGSGVATLGLPNSPGVPSATTTDTLTAPFNDLVAVETLFESYGDEIAAIIVEPVAGNMGFVQPVDGFLSGLRRLTEQHGALLIFDEVMTGFRVNAGGAQTLFDVKPDLTALGKVIGGGLPVGAYGGRRDIMAMVAPSGPMYQAGTLSGNPLAMAAGIATLNGLQAPGVWDGIEAYGEKLVAGLQAAADSAELPFQANRLGTMWGFFFTDTPVTNFDTAAQSDTDAFNQFFHAMLDAGVYLAPSSFEAGFLSAAHGEEQLAATLAAAERAFASLR